MPDPTRCRRRLLAAVSLAVALSLALTACSGDDESSQTADAGNEPTDTTSTAGAITLNGQWPLTGEMLQGALPDHPVYVVKIDNTAASAPQVGLSSADMIVEELVEGGLTRLAVFYHRELPGNVGPVRSMRASDIGIVKPARATLVASGGAPKTVARVASAHIPTLTQAKVGSVAYSRDDSRSAPHNLFISLPDLAEARGGNGHAPTRTYFEFGEASDFAGDIPVTTMSASFSGAQTTEWAYTDKGWTRPNSHAAQGDDFVADNVLMLQVRLGDAGYLDPAGNPVPVTYFEGSGKGVLVHGDKALRVVWQKSKRVSQIELTTPGGRPVTVPVGHTWIELVPAATGEITLSR
jgi:hypothetical protein